MSNQQDMAREYTNAESPYVVELSDEGCGECGKGRMWDVVFKPEDIAGSTTYADEDEAQHEAALCNHAYERGREATESQVAALQEQVKALGEFVQHKRGCSNYSYPHTCNCGLAALSQAQKEQV